MAFVLKLNRFLKISKRLLVIHTKAKIHMAGTTQVFLSEIERFFIQSVSARRNIKTIMGTYKRCSSPSTNLAEKEGAKKIVNQVILNKTNGHLLFFEKNMAAAISSKAIITCI